MPKYVQTLKSAFAFCISPKDWIVLLMLNLAASFYSIFLISSNFDILLSSISAAASSQNLLLLAPLTNLILALLAGSLIYFPLAILIKGAIVHISATGENFEKGMAAAKNRYSTLFLAVLSVSFIMIFLKFVKLFDTLVNLLASIALSLVFFFYLQSAMLGKKGLRQSLRESAKLFISKPFTVFFIYVLLGIFSFLTEVIFSLPLLFLVLPQLDAFLSYTDDTGTAAILAFFKNALNDLQSVFFFSLVIAGATISEIFVLKASTEFYRQIGK